MNWLDDLPEGVCRRDVPLGPLTWFQIGGPADYLVEPRNDGELADVVRRCRDNETPLRVLGLGANVLVPDEGVRGVVVRLSARAFTETRFDGEVVVTGAGVDMTKLVRTCVRRGLAGVEPLAGIPGTVGGGISMNCGGRFGDISTAVSDIQTIDSDGRSHRRGREDLHFGYRSCTLGKDWVTSAAFRLKRTDPETLSNRFREILAYKQASQPALGVQSVGCIFRNPNGHSAGQLIDRAGLKGFRMGSAQVSERHANFAIADRGGRASDVRNLIRTITDRVFDESGIHLDPEVKIW